MVNKTLLTQKETADFLRISISTLNRIRTAGKIRFYKNNLRIVYDYDEHILPYLKEREHNNKDH